MQETSTSTRMESNLSHNLMCLFHLFSSFFLRFGSSVDFITSSQSIKDPETISSGNFKLGFFSPENSTNRYLGIWYLSEPPPIVWVANRNQPLKDSSGILAFSGDGNLMVSNLQNHTLWSSNVSIVYPNSSIIAQLLDTGNLVLKDNNTGITLWESFDHPSDTFMQKMKLRTNARTGGKTQLTSWKSPSDPSIGSFSASLERPHALEGMIFNKSKPHWRSGPWNGTVFLGTYQMTTRYLTGFYLGKDDDGTSYITYDNGGQSYFGLLKLNSMGQFVLAAWHNRTLVVPWTHYQDSKCDVYGLCMEFGICNRKNSTLCRCLTGFEPKKPKEWNTHNWTNGCVRRTPLQCEGDGFLKLENMKVPDFANRADFDEPNCRAQCLENCWCFGYAYDSYIQCLYWNDSLIDMQRFPSGGVDLYIRLANSELVKKEEKNDDKTTDDKGRNKRKLILKVMIAISVTIGGIIVAACSYFFWANASKSKGTANEKYHRESTRGSKHEKLEELPLFDYETIVTATNNFHLDNKIGEGGFGSVYKGELQEAQQIIAVKRLSRVSRQGLEEFMNEVKVISKLQHRNLVKLLGCCIEQEENMLIYEYMPNKSLDAMLFDQKKLIVLNWEKRYVIIEGIARGLLYLHKDSRLKIIHRDLKAGNILLDGRLNPRISDFGLAKIFGDSEVTGKTKRIVGTHGYMSLEYALKGFFSEKSNVFSFGVLLLEIIGGIRSIDFYSEEMSLSLQGYAWKLWNENNAASFIDPKMDNPSFCKDIIRCIQIGLLCVQELASDRPNMSLVTSMICSEIIDLPLPKQPAFSIAELSQQNDRECSINRVSLTDIQAR